LKPGHHFAVRSLLAVVIVAALLDAGDYLWLQFRIARPQAGAALGSVTMDRPYAVPLKSGKVEYYENQPYTQTCVHSIFPHLNYSPCWYLNRQKQKPIPMTVFAPGAPGAVR
jgi:hypothetical protein